MKTSDTATGMDTSEVDVVGVTEGVAVLVPVPDPVAVGVAVDELVGVPDEVIDEVSEPVSLALGVCVAVWEGDTPAGSVELGDGVREPDCVVEADGVSEDVGDGVAVLDAVPVCVGVAEPVGVVVGVGVEDMVIVDVPVAV